MGHLVAVDLETSGLDPDVHEIIEVGLVWIQNERYQEFEFSLSFDQLMADPKALELNGWGKRQFAKYMSKGDAARFLMSLLNDAHLVGKNPATFDARFLETFLRANNGTWKKPWHHRMVDVGAVAMGRYGLINPPNTEAVERLTGVKLKNRHSALADARWAWDVLHRMVEVKS